MKNRPTTGRMLVAITLFYCVGPLMLLLVWPALFGEHGVCQTRMCRLVSANVVWGLAVFLFLRMRMKTDEHKKRDGEARDGAQKSAASDGGREPS
jgi:hypothetical protein